MFRLNTYFISVKIILCFVAILGWSAGFAQNTSSVIPVVFHIISNGPSTITDQQIKDAVQDLNDAFAHTGPYATGTPGANTKITFCLAKINPDGGITNGITRTQSSLSNFDEDIEDSRLKGLVSWNPSQYCNIWFVDSVKNEYYTRFSCDTWIRKQNKTYASFLPGGDYHDGIVTNEFGPVLAGLMGGYLGLKTTFVYNSCANSDCSKDGDGICDTPPAAAEGSCNAAQNSCSSDTTSGFTIDVPDLNANFMSLSGSCSNSFTEGQAAKMREVLTGLRKELLEQNKCNPPCTENISADFTRDNWLPAPGDLIHFTASASGGTNFQWSVNGVNVGANSLLYMQSFPAPGKYKVMLKVFNTNNACFASYSDSIIIGSGLMARFTPDKRLIASKDQILTDNIFFKNLSVNANSFQWWMSSSTGMSPQIVSSAFDLDQIFHSPGNYSVWLVASNGNAHDTSGKFNFTVNDPTSDGIVGFQEVECYEQNKIYVKFNVCNYGYVSIPAGTPVSFYDGDPLSGTGRRLGPVFIVPTPVKGNCCTSFDIVLDVGSPGLNQLYAVFNDNGNARPLILPNSSLPELNYSNNIAFAKDFQFKVTVDPGSATLKPGDTLRLYGSGGPGIVSSYTWSYSPELSCTDCADPIFIAGKNDVQEKLIVTSHYSCVDSARVDIKILPPDFTTQILETHCFTNDSLLVKFSICVNNGYDSLLAGIPVAFYDGNIADQGNLLEPVFYTSKIVSGNCDNFSTTIKTPLSGNLTIVVNDKGNNHPNNLDNAFVESDYTNNSSGATVTPFSVSVYPKDTTVSRNMPVPLHFEASGGQATEFTWHPSEFITCANCPDPIIIPSHSIQYEIDVQNEYACTAKAYARINTFTGGKVNIPNAFTPNGDGHNDVFYIMGGQEIKNIKEFSIFNRWGQPVFKKTNIQANDSGSGWNGLINGSPAPAGTYVYIAVIEFSDGSQQVYKGSLIVIL